MNASEHNDLHSIANEAKRLRCDHKALKEESERIMLRLKEASNSTENLCRVAKELCERARLLVLAARAIRVENRTIIKECKACGTTYKPSQWFNLRLVGYTIHDKVGGEMRQCTCGSTIMITTRKEM